MFDTNFDPFDVLEAEWAPKVVKNRLKVVEKTHKVGKNRHKVGQNHLKTDLVLKRNYKNMASKDNNYLLVTIHG